ncbi:MAG: hypothetical protein H0W84_04925 [Bacteroidetes bacterium]|nr:hypothetical protein [Bacteroidota bacterium]
METTDQPINEQDSLRIIHEMIASAKSGIKDNGFFYLLWGWLVLIASLTNYFLQFVIVFDKPWLSWAILMPLGGIISMIAGAKMKKKQKVRTHLDDFIKFLLIAFLVCLFVTLFFAQKFQLTFYPVVMMLYGIWLFVSGGALGFRPLIIGGIINWIFAVAALFVAFEYQLLMISAAVLLGYIIPGHILNYQFKKNV